MLCIGFDKVSKYVVYVVIFTYHIHFDVTVQLGSSFALTWWTYSKEQNPSSVFSGEQ